MVLILSVFVACWLGQGLAQICIVLGLNEAVAMPLPYLTMLNTAIWFALFMAQDQHLVRAHWLTIAPLAWAAYGLGGAYLDVVAGPPMLFLQNFLPDQHAYSFFWSAIGYLSCMMLAFRRRRVAAPASVGQHATPSQPATTPSQPATTLSAQQLDERREWN